MKKITKKEYLLDKEPVDWQELISRAKNYGYTGDSYGIFYTSSAADLLRRKGHTVEQNKL